MSKGRYVGPKRGERSHGSVDYINKFSLLVWKICRKLIFVQRARVGKGQGEGGGREGEGAPIISLSTGPPYYNILTPTIQFLPYQSFFYLN
jgi:hypothetical protein